MKYIYFDASAGLSGDMILGALIDLGVPPSLFKEKMAEFNLPVDIHIQETKRASLRGVKVNVRVKARKTIARKWPDIESLIKRSPFSSLVKKNSLNIFRKLFEAEARVHGYAFSEAHIHEVGADDAIVDITGTCFLAEVLEISEFYSSPLNLGQGLVKTSHGLLPVPPPAVAELLKGIPVYAGKPEEELVTPTGAAIVSALVKKFTPLPEITYEKIGCGAGERDFPHFPNILRVFYGKTEQFRAEKKVLIIESNIDDSNPQILAAFLDKAFQLGALDVYLTPILMKKNRLATKLTILTEIGTIDTLIQAIFEETSSIGVRYFPVERRVLEREIRKVRILGQDVAVKIASLEGKEINIQPEYSECLKLAEKKKLPLKEVMELAVRQFYAKHESRGRKKEK